jgi:hypothetical protein
MSLQVLVARRVFLALRSGDLLGSSEGVEEDGNEDKEERIS